ncbi:MAG: lysophospholipase [Christensenellaceae bacterium]|jgi:alpha-beta hydrolase superfamily lysophospholipase|nr:lysophospholipase [Christensenellaceae bacterium]
MKSTIQTMQMRDGETLRVAKFEPDGPVLGVLQLLHGFGEHIGHYEKLCAFLAQNGYACVVHDQRGFGEMPGKTPKERARARGVVPSYAAFLGDIAEIREKIAKWFTGLPVFLFGCSMGGNIALNLLLQSPESYAKAIVESPWLRLYKPLPGPVSAFAGLLGRLSPRLAIRTRLNTAAISRDQGEVGRLVNDGIFHDRMSFRLYSEIVAAGESAIAGASQIATPTLLLCAGADRIVSAPAIRELAKNAGPNLRLEEFDGGFHCLHHDILRAEIEERILSFLK